MVYHEYSKTCIPDDEQEEHDAAKRQQEVKALQQQQQQQQQRVLRQLLLEAEEKAAAEAAAAATRRRMQQNLFIVIVILLALFGGYSLLSPIIQNLPSAKKDDQKLELQRMANREWLEQEYRKLSPEKAKTEDFQVFLDQTLARYIADPQRGGLLGLHQNLERKYKKIIKQPPHFGKKLVKDL